MKKKEKKQAKEKKTFRDRWIENKAKYSLFMGMAFAIVGFFTSWLLFRHTPGIIGIATILFTVIISMPFINKILEVEERIETKEKEGFWKEHESIMDLFIYLFLGVFIVFFTISMVNSSWIFSKDQLYIPSNEKAESGIENIPAELLAAQPPAVENNETWKIFRNNLYVLIIAFILSLVYGSGAMFLIVLNVSIFTSALIDAMRLSFPLHGTAAYIFSFVVCNVGVLLFHMLPEVVSYLFAAIAGGVLSKAILREKILSKRFFEVVKDSFILMAISITALIVAALIETKISKKLMLGNFCAESMHLIIVITCLLIAGLIGGEIYRKLGNRKTR